MLPCRIDGWQLHTRSANRFPVPQHIVFQKTGPVRDEFLFRRRAFGGAARVLYLIGGNRRNPSGLNR